jgi:CheY-like chemotaxis protein
MVEKTDFKNKTLLIVEDTESSIRFFDAALKRTGADILLASDGDEAIKLFDYNNVDLVLLDLNLYKTSGFEVLKHIRKEDKKVPVIVQTAYILSGEEQESRDLGADDFIAKPIKLENLMLILKKYLS